MRSQLCRRYILAHTWCRKLRAKLKMAMSQPGTCTHTCKTKYNAKKLWISGSGLCQRDECVDSFKYLYMAKAEFSSLPLYIKCSASDWKHYICQSNAIISAFFDMLVVVFAVENVYLSPSSLLAVRCVPVYELWQEQELHSLHAGSVGGGICQVAGQPSR